HRRALGRLLVEALAAEAVPDASLVDHDRRLGHSRRDGRRVLPQQLAELALELADARLARVLADDQLEGDVVDRHLVLAQAGAVALARPQIATRDRDLLVD